MVGVEGDRTFLDRITGVRAVCTNDIEVEVVSSTQSGPQLGFCGLRDSLVKKIVDLQNKRVLVVGLGKSGVASALFLK